MSIQRQPGHDFLREKFRMWIAVCTLADGCIYYFLLFDIRVILTQYVFCMAEKGHEELLSLKDGIWLYSSIFAREGYRTQRHLLLSLVLLTPCSIGEDESEAARWNRPKLLLLAILSA